MLDAYSPEAYLGGSVGGFNPFLNQKAAVHFSWEYWGASRFSYKYQFRVFWAMPEDVEGTAVRFRISP